MGFIIAGIISLWVALRWFKVRVKIPSPIAIKQELKNGWHIFISKMAIGLYTTSNTVILGIFTNNTIVGYYAAGEKIIRAITGMITPLSQTIYPHISRVASESKERALSFIRKMLMLIEVPLFLISIAVFLFAHHISNLVLGEHFQESIPIIRILSFLPFIVAASIMLGSHTLLVFGIKRLFSKSIIFPALIHITLLLFIIPFWGATGVAIVRIFTELLILFWRVIGIRIFHKELFTGIFCNETKS
jgi:PST family polysaccharide transporter